MVGTPPTPASRHHGVEADIGEQPVHGADATVRAVSGASPLRFPSASQRDGGGSSKVGVCRNGSTMIAAAAAGSAIGSSDRAFTGQSH